MARIGMTLRMLAGLWGFLVGMIHATEMLGSVGLVLGIVLFPVTMTLGPLYGALAHGAWLPLLGPIVLGIVGLVLIGIGLPDDDAVTTRA